MSCDQFTVCIPAAGEGKRMGLDFPKQYAPLLGIPVIVHTVRLFASIPACTRIILSADDPGRLRSILESHRVPAAYTVVEGGTARQFSVLNCLDAVQGDSITLIHDAVRPCVTVQEVLNVVQAITEHGAALLALSSRDTIKSVHADGSIRMTLPRGEVYLAQTPQGARHRILHQAYTEACSSGEDLTDDVQALERRGIPVFVVEGSPSNIKLTNKEDLIIAEAILRNRV